MLRLKRVEMALRLLKDGLETSGPVAVQALESDPPEYGTPRAKAVTVDLNAMSTMDPAVAATYEASRRNEKRSGDAQPDAAASGPGRSA